MTELITNMFFYYISGFVVVFLTGFFWNKYINKKSSNDGTLEFRAVLLGAFFSWFAFVLLLLIWLVSSDSKINKWFSGKSNN